MTSADDFFQDLEPNEGSQQQQHQLPRTPPRLGVLASLAPDEFDAVARAAQLAFVDVGTTIFRQGDAADRFFVLVEGSVSIERDGELVATLAPGGFFGESALLVDGLRSATVTTVTDSAVWSIGYAAFEAAVQHHFLADDDTRAEAERRIAATPSEAFADPAERDGPGTAD